MGKRFQENKDQMQRLKNIESCANFKEEVITLPQINILPFSKLHYKPIKKSYFIPFCVFLYQ